MCVCAPQCGATVSRNYKKLRRLPILTTNNFRLSFLLIQPTRFTMIVHVEEIAQESTTFSWPPLPECALISSPSSRSSPGSPGSSSSSSGYSSSGSSSLLTPSKSPKKLTKKLASLLKKTFLVKQDVYPVGEIEAKIAAFDQVHTAQLRQRQTAQKRQNRKASCVDSTVFVNAEIDRPIRALTAASVRSVTRAHAPISDDHAICTSLFSEDQLRYATIRRSYSMRYKGFGRRCY